MGYKFIKKLPFCLPFRKADDAPSSSLSRACSRRLRLRPWCLESGASSTFAHLGCSFAWKICQNYTKFHTIWKSPFYSPLPEYPADCRSGVEIPIFRGWSETEIPSNGVVAERRSRLSGLQGWKARWTERPVSAKSWRIRKLIRW